MKFVAFTRELQGTGASRRLRIAGKVPAIVYGGTASPAQIELDHNALFHALKKEVFHSSVLEMELGGETTKVVLRALQMHPFKPLVLHADFQRVDATTRLRKKVPLHFINEDTSPAGKAADVVVTHELKEVTITCLPKDLPESIEVDLGELKAGDVVYLSNIKLPKGVEIPALALGKDHDDAIVTAKAGKADAADEEAAAAE